MDYTNQASDRLMRVPDDVLGDNFELKQYERDSFLEHRQVSVPGVQNVYHNSVNVFDEENILSGNVSTNFTNMPLPREMTFTADNLVSVVAYSCMFFIATTGNLTVFITLFRTRGIKSRVNSFIMHLSIADLIVALIMLPLETAWHITVAWLAGDIACRILMFFRAFGFYLSSFVLVTISLDRYYSIVHPLSIHDADRRAKILLTFAWLLSAIASIPQSVIFHVERHPVYTHFEQCVTFNFFPTPTHELAYNLFNLITVYLLPLLVITTSYICILWTISKNARQAKENCRIQRDIHPPKKPSASRSLLRCSNTGRIGKAKIRTLKMTLVIVCAFIICWTPYFFMSALWWFQRESARQVDSKLQRGLFLFAVSNSCVNPILYGKCQIRITLEATPLVRSSSDIYLLEVIQTSRTSYYGMFTTAFRREASKWKVWFKLRLNNFGILNSPQPSTVEQEYLA